MAQVIDQREKLQLPSLAVSESNVHSHDMGAIAPAD